MPPRKTKKTVYRDIVITSAAGAMFGLALAITFQLSIYWCPFLGACAGFLCYAPKRTLTKIHKNALAGTPLINQQTITVILLVLRVNLIHIAYGAGTFGSAYLITRFLFPDSSYVSLLSFSFGLSQYRLAYWTPCLITNLCEVATSAANPIDPYTNKAWLMMRSLQPFIALYRPVSKFVTVMINNYLDEPDTPRPKTLWVFMTIYISLLAALLIPAMSIICLFLLLVASLDLILNSFFHAMTTPRLSAALGSAIGCVIAAAIPLEQYKLLLFIIGAMIGCLAGLLIYAFNSYLARVAKAQATSK